MKDSLNPMSFSLNSLKGVYIGDIGILEKNGNYYLGFRV